MPTEALQSAARFGAWFLVFSSALFLHTLIMHSYATWVSTQSYQFTQLLIYGIALVTIEVFIAAAFGFTLSKHILGYLSLVTTADNRIFIVAVRVFSISAIAHIAGTGTSLIGVQIERVLINSSAYDRYLAVPELVTGSIYMASACLFGLFALTAHRQIGSFLALWFACVGVLWGLFFVFDWIGISTATVILAPAILEWLYVLPGIFLFLHLANNRRV